MRRLFVEGRSILDFTLIERATGEKKLLIKPVSGNYGTQAVQVYDPVSHQSMTAWSATDSMTSWVEWWLPANRNGVRGIVPYAATSHASVFIVCVRQTRPRRRDTAATALPAASESMYYSEAGCQL